MEKITFLFITILMILGCNTKPEIQLGKFKTITQNFNEEQIEGLNNLLAFFDKEVCNSVGMEGNEILDCYQKYFEKLALAAKTGNLNINLSYPKQTEFLSKIDRDLFQEIWHEGEMRTPKRTKEIRNIKPDTINLNFIKLDGGYANFLNSLSEENEKIKFYSKPLHMVGEISPSMLADVLMNYKDYDISDERIRLVIAIHYLTLNELNEKRAELKNRMEAVEK